MYQPRGSGYREDQGDHFKVTLYLDQIQMQLMMNKSHSIKKETSYKEDKKFYRNPMEAASLTSARTENGVCTFVDPCSDSSDFPFNLLPIPQGNVYSCDFQFLSSSQLGLQSHSRYSLGRSLPGYAFFSPDHSYSQDVMILLMSRDSIFQSTVGGMIWLMPALLSGGSPRRWAL